MFFQLIHGLITTIIGLVMSILNFGDIGAIEDQNALRHAIVKRSADEPIYSPRCQSGFACIPSTLCTFYRKIAHGEKIAGDTCDYPPHPQGSHVCCPLPSIPNKPGDFVDSIRGHSKTLLGVVKHFGDGVTRLTLKTFRAPFAHESIESNVQDEQPKTLDP